ncbi:hypothetical protein IF2G_05805 [Cordyceps javanica]|nr:hypothetical protein IF2G_05805 [Cordyceps javanica]
MCIGGNFDDGKVFKSQNRLAGSVPVGDSRTAGLQSAYVTGGPHGLPFAVQGHQIQGTAIIHNNIIALRFLLSSSSSLGTKECWLRIKCTLTVRQPSLPLRDH